MPLVTGTKLGPYEIVERLGAGGMGEVYRARDSRLKRDVALKVLPQAFAGDAQRMARFEREAQLLAALNYPNIASIYGLEESQDVRALVMELVEGPTLAERIAQGPLSLEEALSIAKQIADALEYAHERGIIHRDLKPANIKITQDGNVKVLDFGLAKALSDDISSQDASSSPTVSVAATRAGVLLGTAAYMAPEQARGKAADRRADVWAFGCVLFEMLAGKATFAAETSSDTFAAVLTKEPDWSRLPAATPPAIRRLLYRCLQKDARTRLQAIGDARIEIEATLAGKESGEFAEIFVGKAQEQERTSRRWFGVVTAVAAGVLLLITVGLTVEWMQSRNATAPGWTGDMIPGPSIAIGPRISPDGRTLAFQAMIDNMTQVAVASPDSGNWTLLTHNRQHGFVNEISWSPDGSKLYYDRTIATPVGIYSVLALGGEERLVLENAGTPEVLPDGSLLLIRGDAKGRWRIHRYWPDSQRLEPLGGWISIGTTIPLRVFPDGKEAVFNGAASENDTSAQLYVLDIATGKARSLTSGLPSRANNESYPIAPTTDGRAVLVDVSAGDLHRIIAVPRDGKGNIRTVLTLTRPPWYMDVAKDGTVYLDQVDRPHEILRFPTSGGSPEVLGSSDTFVSGEQYMEPMETSDGRFLLDTEFSGRGRLLIGKPGSDFLPLLDTNEDTSSPSAAMSNNEVALVVGSGSEAQIAIASATQGRILRRLQGTKGKQFSSMAVSPDSKTFYFGANGSIWSIPASDGVPQKLIEGDSVIVDPVRQELVVTQHQLSSPVFVRVPLGKGEPTPIAIESGISAAPVPTASRALSKEGKLLITISPSDSWFYRVVMLDTASGRVTPIQLNYPGDTLSGSWTADGRVIAVGLPLKSHLWRFRPAK